jgi:hypothetical protein
LALYLSGCSALVTDQIVSIAAREFNVDAASEQASYDIAESIVSLTAR